MSATVVEPYNAILATHNTFGLAECTFMIDNEAIYDIITRRLEIEQPNYCSLNQVVAQVCYDPLSRSSNNSFATNGCGFFQLLEFLEILPNGL